MVLYKDTANHKLVCLLFFDFHATFFCKSTESDHYEEYVYPQNQSIFQNWTQTVPNCREDAHHSGFPGVFVPWDHSGEHILPAGDV